MKIFTSSLISRIIFNLFTFHYQVQLTTHGLLFLYFFIQWAHVLNLKVCRIWRLRSQFLFLFPVVNESNITIDKINIIEKSLNSLINQNEDAGFSVTINYCPS